jgi:hypothetical protein
MFAVHFLNDQKTNQKNREEKNSVGWLVILSLKNFLSASFKQLFFVENPSFGSVVIDDTIKLSLDNNLGSIFSASSLK